jgi:DNA-binding CsgD family transcriptional regulator
MFSQEIHQIVGYLNRGMSVHVVGPRGSGRSQLLHELVGWLEDTDHAVLQLRGISALSQEPYAAFAGLDMPEDFSRHTLVDIVGALRRFAQRRSPILIVDDAEDLDRDSAGAILAWHAEAKVPAVTSSRSHHRHPKGSLMLGLAPSVRLTTPSLELNRLHNLAVDILGGPMDPLALSRVAMRSGGLYGLAKAMLSVGKETGQITQNDDGLWVVSGVFWSDLLAGVVVPYLADIGPTAYEGATALAVTGPLPVPDAEKLVGREVLRDLFSEGIAHYIEYGTTAVTGVFPPLLADLLSRDGSPLGRSRAMEFGPFHPRSGAERQPVTSDVALISHQVEQASAAVVDERRKTWTGEKTPKSAMPLVIAMQNAWTPSDDIAAVIRQTVIEGEDLPSAMFVVWSALWNATNDGDIERAAEYIESYRPQMPHFDALLRAGIAHIQFLHNTYPSEELLAPPGPGEDANGSDLLAGVRIELAIAQGLTGQARHLLADYAPISFVFSVYGAMWTALSDILNGDLERGIQISLAHLDGARERMNVNAMQAFGYTAALGMVLAGKLGEADKVLEAILSTSPVAAFRESASSGLLSLGAMLALWQGRPAYARALAARSSSSSQSIGPFPGMVPWPVEAMMRKTATGQNPGPEMWRNAEEQLNTGYVTSGLLIGFEAVEYSSNNRIAKHLRQVGGLVDSPMLAMLADYVFAANERDTDAMAECIDKFVGAGYMHFAVRAAVLRALTLRKSGNLVESAQQATEAWELSATAGGERAGLFKPLVDDISLTSREYEVVNVLASGLLNVDAATILDMSVRTIETHLHNIAKKVGYPNKEALIDAASTWLRPVGR